MTTTTDRPLDAPPRPPRRARRPSWSRPCSAALDAPGHLPRRSPGAVSRAGRGRSGDGPGAGRAGRHPRRATPASGSSTRPSARSSTSTTSTRRPMRAGTRCRPATRRSSSTRRAWRYMAPLVPFRGRFSAAHARHPRARTGRAAASTGRTTARTSSRPRRASTDPSSHHLVGDWIDALPDIAARLRDGDGRVADVACGTGWSSISIARALPGRSQVDGIDIDAGSIERATAQRRPRRADRPGLVPASPTRPTADGAGRYDLVTIFEAVHDMARPAEVLAAARRLLAPGGAVLIGDERVAETFTAPGDEAERLFYGYSVVACLANGLVDQPSVGTGHGAAAGGARGDRPRGRLHAASRSCRSSTRPSASTAWIRRRARSNRRRRGVVAADETRR